MRNVLLPLLLFAVFASLDRGCVGQGQTVPHEKIEQLCSALSELATTSLPIAASRASVRAFILAKDGGMVDYGYLPDPMTGEGAHAIARVEVNPNGRFKFLAVPRWWCYNLPPTGQPLTVSQQSMVNCAALAVLVHEAGHLRRGNECLPGSIDPSVPQPPPALALQPSLAWRNLEEVVASFEEGTSLCHLALGAVAAPEKRNIRQSRDRIFGYAEREIETLSQRLGQAVAMGASPAYVAWLNGLLTQAQHLRDTLRTMFQVFDAILGS